MADVVDRANDRMMQELEARLAARPVPGLAVRWCEVCGVEIPPARRAAVPGCRTCIDCQQVREVSRG